MLLIELEESRGNHVVNEEDVSSADISSTSEVISQHLVTFRSVEELQKQNQRLLVALRDLSDAQEKEEFEATGNMYVNTFVLYLLSFHFLPSIFNVYIYFFQNLYYLSYTVISYITYALACCVCKRGS